MSRTRAAWRARRSAASTSRATARCWRRWCRRWWARPRSWHRRALRARPRAATAAAEAQLGTEIGRLEALARVNPGVRPEEIAAARAELMQLREVLPSARARLDSLRFVASADFLALRG